MFSTRPLIWRFRFIIYLKHAPLFGGAIMYLQYTPPDWRFGFITYLQHAPHLVIPVHHIFKTPPHLAISIHHIP